MQTIRKKLQNDTQSQTIQDKKSYILYIITKSNWGGAQKYVYDLATSNIRKDYKIKVLAGGNGELIKNLEKENIEVIKVNTLKNTLNPIKTFLIFNELYKIIKKENPSLVHVNSSLAGLIVSIICKIQKRKCVFTAHGWPHKEDRNILIKLLLKWLMIQTVKMSSKTLAVSENIKYSLSKSKDIIEKMEVIYLGIKKEKVNTNPNTSKNKLSLTDKNLHVVSVGEMNKNKNHISFVRVMKYFPDIHYHIIGQDSGEKENIEEEIKKYNLENKVTLYGHKNNIIEEIRKFDIFLLPSSTEALGYVVLEALQAGLPVIARRVGGIPEILKNLNYAATYKEDYELIKLIPNFTKSKSKKFVWNDKRFDFENMISETKNVYDKVLNN